MRKNDTDKNEFNYSHYPFYAENTYRYNNSAEAEDYKAFVYDTYLEIPGKTQIELRRIADQEGFLDSELTVSEKIEMVKNYISNSKTYSLKTPKMPSGKDFATWFLNESNTGYCVHFATAGTLMLRALGIPARYVTGYYATAYANQTVTVTTDNAHAWVEYYSDTAGWIPLECTPSSFQPARYVGSQRASGGSTDTTQPTTVEPTTAPTAPTNGTVSHGTKPKNDSKSLFEFNGFTIAMMSLGIVALALIAIFSRRIIIIKKRKQRFETGRNNKRAICIYKELKNLTKISHLLITDEVKSVYEKARFSNNTISDDELKIIENAYYNSVEEIYNNLPRIKKAVLQVYKGNKIRHAPVQYGSVFTQKALENNSRALDFALYYLKKILFVIIILIDKLVLFVKIAVTALEKSRAKTIIVICHSANSVSKNCNTHQKPEN